MANGCCSKCDSLLDGASKSYCKACNAKYYREKRAQNREANNAYQREYRKTIPTEQRRANRRRYGLKYNYNLTVEEYEAMYEKQERCCAICKDELPMHGKNVHVDHCHESGNVRGILCTRCNVGIGQLRHDPQIIEAAITYLTKVEV